MKKNKFSDENIIFLGTSSNSQSIINFISLLHYPKNVLNLGQTETPY